MGYTKEEAEKITQRRCIKGMMKDLNTFERGKYLNDKRLLTIWNILREFEKELN